MISSSAASRQSVRSLAAGTSLRRAGVSAVRRTLHQHVGVDEGHAGMNDLILSILQANPSIRDAKTYLGTFGSKTNPTTGPVVRHAISPAAKNPLNLPADVLASQTQTAPAVVTAIPNHQAALALLNPTQRRTALVKFQGPFTDRQLESICRGMVYLEKLGLVSVIVVERDDWHPGQDGERNLVREDVLRIAAALETQGAKARPILDPLVRLGPPADDDDTIVHEPLKKLLLSENQDTQEIDLPRTEVQAHARLGDLVPIRSALKAGEIPVLAPLALDSFSRMVRIDSNHVVAALVKSMVHAGQVAQRPTDSSTTTDPISSPPSDDDGLDLTPLRLMIINREGGVPSYARQGLPHLLINLTSEHSHITRTFDPTWNTTHPTSLANLSLSQTCLNYMPPTSSAIIVSHRSPRSLIANLITNKPAQSSSLPAYLLTSGAKKVTPHTPTLIRKGLPMRVIQRERIDEIDKAKLTHLLEMSFRRTLDAQPFYARLEKVLDYAIIAGDYAGACIVTQEPIPSSSSSPRRTLSYLDKFAVHPDHQGDGTVDFLWVALHDESFGLGLAHALNPNEGGKMGVGTGRDLVWRSRTDNPANRWYYERASGHLRLDGGYWTMFWCDAEDRLKEREDKLIEETWTEAKVSMGRKGRGVDGLSFVERSEEGRLDDWAEVVKDIPGSWLPLK
ncbi:Amino-acid acetyltransferase, mitochondrial [Tulasnella sp. 403]|nr:Amino-acid acetyltransferase, mitochondrial [Tulasnella sp. 403]